MFDTSFYGNLLLQFIVLIYFLMVYKKWNFSRGKTSTFTTVITSLLFFIFFHALAILGNVGSPIGLLYGPLIYLTFCALNEKRSSFLHLFPYSLFSFTYFVCYSVRPLYDLAGNLLDRYYYPSYLFLMPLLLLFYSLLTLRQRIKEKNNNRAHNEYILLDTLIFLSATVAILLFIAAIEPYGHFQWGMQSVYLVYMLLALAACYLIFHLIKSPKIDQAELVKSKHKVDMQDQLLADNIRSIIASQQLYLDPDINLQKLAAIAEVPTWQVSKVLNKVIGKNFYELIAAYRIAHAKQLIASDVFNKLTLEHIAQQSGFKSKSSFNRYFKSIEQCSPQEYKKRS